jgi:hypothetical protein
MVLYGARRVLEKLLKGCCVAKVVGYACERCLLWQGVLQVGNDVANVKHQQKSSSNKSQVPTKVVRSRDVWLVQSNFVYQY